MLNDRKKLTFKVTLVPPRGATVGDCRAYIEDAVISLKGTYHPDEPMSELDRTTVRVSHIPEKFNG